MNSKQAGDAVFMARALALAEHGRYSARPNPCVGCVLTKDGVVIAEGWHEYAGGPHAEVTALRAAGTAAAGSSCYVSLEPCCHHGRTPPCTEALIRAGVARVFVAMEDPNPQVRGAGVAALRRAGLNVEVGTLAAESAALNRGFIQRMQRQRPFVRLKLAASLDGRTATPGGESKWITGEDARADVQHWRAVSGAVLTGIGTVLADDPRLTVREQSMLSAAGQPLRVVTDSELRFPFNASMLEADGKTLVATTVNSSMAPCGPDDASRLEVLRFPPDNGRVPLESLLHTLAGREINDVLVESGAVLAGALLKQGLVDELLIYLAPSLLGDKARGMAAIEGLESLSDAVALEYRDVTRVGSDLRITATVVAGKV